MTLVPSNLPMTTVVGLYSLRKESLGDCHATYSLESSAVSVSLSPTSRHLLVGLTSRCPPGLATDHFFIGLVVICYITREWKLLLYILLEILVVVDNHGHLYVWDDEITHKKEVHVNLKDYQLIK